MSNPGGNPSSLIPFTKETRPFTPGRPKGKKTRETIARRILELNAQKTITKDRWLEICERYPTLARQNVDIEEVMTTIQVGKAIFKEDSKAYELVMNMAYKPHKPGDETQTTYIFSSNLSNPYADNPPTGTVDVIPHKPDEIEDN